MKIILREDVPDLGAMGDLVDVKPGYARNFLLPQKKALRASKENITLFESQRSEIEGRNLEQRKEAEAVAAKIEGKTVVLIRQAGESGQLYGNTSTCNDWTTTDAGAGRPRFWCWAGWLY